MADRAQVTSVEAIEAFRSNLLVYLSKARPAIEEVSSEVMRTRLWVQENQRRFWEHQHRIRFRKLERARAELSSARMSLIQTVSAAQQLEVRRAQHAVDEAETKLALLKKWSRELENRTAPLLKQVEQLHGFFCSDLAKAVAYLAQVVKTLEAYASITPGAGRPSPAGASSSEAAPPPDAEAAPSAESGAPAAESADPELERRSPTRQESLAEDHASPGAEPADSATGVTNRDRTGQEQRADPAVRPPGAPEGGAE